jgi:hypothetical protein
VQPAAGALEVLDLPQARPEAWCTRKRALPLIEILSPPMAIIVAAEAVRPVVSTSTRAVALQEVVDGQSVSDEAPSTRWRGD